MPKAVDRSERREALLAAVWRVIARDGLERATIRTIAEETGWSTGVLAHYFADKEDILASALQLSHELIVARWDQKLEGLEGLAALRELVLDNLPLDDEREQETRFLMNYWSRSTRTVIGDGRAIDEAEWRRGPRLVDRLAGLIAEAQAAGEITVADDPNDLAERLLALIDGLSLHSLLDPQRVTRERQAELAHQELDRLSVSHSQGEAHA
jgi:AcrR family transcriptional regulator